MEINAYCPPCAELVKVRTKDNKRKSNASQSYFPLLASAECNERNAPMSALS
jgi:hypothetical protein